MKEKSKWIILGVCLGLFIVIAIFLFNGKIDSFDNKVYDFLISFKSNGLTSYFKLITKLANTIIIIIFCIVILILFYKKKQSIYLVGTVIISTIINQTLKHLITRPRPVGINLITETGYSFPSGHAMASVTFYGFIIYLIINSNLPSKLKWIITFLLTFIIINICLSRIYLGVHFASDVGCGALLAISLLLIVTFYINKYEERNYEKSFSNRSK